jgi:hypothetical protein
MFFTELSPVVQELTRNPIAFLGGFAAGMLRLDLTQDPVKSWLDKQGAGPGPGGPTPPASPSGPQSISID